METYIISTENLRMMMYNLWLHCVRYQCISLKKMQKSFTIGHNLYRICYNLIFLTIIFIKMLGKMYQ